MNNTLKFANGNVVISIPQGLRSLLEYLAKETIRKQPENVEEHIYNLVTQLLAKRGEGEKADAENPPVNPTKTEAVPSEKEAKYDDEDAEIGQVEFAKLSESTKMRVTSEREAAASLASSAATKIQAGFRGYKTRKTLKLAAEEEKRTDAEIAAELKSPLMTIKEESFELLNASAIKIQACFRGYLVRRDGGKFMHLQDVAKEPQDEAEADIPADISIAGDTNKLTELDLHDLEEQIIPSEREEDQVNAIVNVNAPSVDDSTITADINEIPFDIEAHGNSKASVDTSFEEPKSGEVEVDVILEKTDVSEESPKDEDVISEKVSESEESPKVEDVISKSVSESEESPPRTEEGNVSEKQDVVEIKIHPSVLSQNSATSISKAENDPELKSSVDDNDGSEKGTMTCEIPIADAMTTTECETAEILTEADPTPSSPPIPNIIQDSLAVVEVSESLVDSIMQEVETTMLDKNDSEDVGPIPEIAVEPEPVVIRRKSKRSSAVDSKTKSAYRSGVVGLEDEYNRLVETTSLPSLDEVEALVEQEVLDNAATKIQAGFRGYKARKSINKASTAASKIQAGFRGFKTRKTIATEKKAVIKIQATVRGFLARRRLAKAKQMRQRRRSSTSSLLNRRRKSSNTLNAAAVRIQAAYRGYRVRRASPLPQDDDETELISDSEIKSQ